MPCWWRSNSMMVVTAPTTPKMPPATHASSRTVIPRAPSAARFKAECSSPDFSLSVLRVSLTADPDYRSSSGVTDLRFYREGKGKTPYQLGICREGIVTPFSLRLGRAVTRRLLLDLLATGGRTVAEAAFDVFARRDRCWWWELQGGSDSSDLAS